MAEARANWSRRSRSACGSTRRRSPIQGPPGLGQDVHRRADDRGAGRGRQARSASRRRATRSIGNLLDEVCAAAPEAASSVRAHAEGRRGRSLQRRDRAVRRRQRRTCCGALAAGEIDIAAGTGWLWSREDFVGTVDTLFVDEAGQMSLANVLAMAGAARNIVLLGDPQQLDQPVKGSHPPGAEKSALEHMLGERQTIPRRSRPLPRADVAHAPGHLLASRRRCSTTTAWSPSRRWSASR